MGILFNLRAPFNLPQGENRKKTHFNFLTDNSLTSQKENLFYLLPE